MYFLTLWTDYLSSLSPLQLRELAHTHTHTHRRMGGSITRRTGACLPHCMLPSISKEHMQCLLEHHKLNLPSTRSNGFMPLYVWSGHGTNFVLGYECWEMACPSHMTPGLPKYLDPTAADVEYANIFECMRGM